MSADPSAPASSGSSFWSWLALLVSVAAVGGSLFLSIGMGLKACPLCLYQRTFMMGVAAILLVGLLAGARPAPLLALLALPLAVGGGGVAGFHEYLEITGKLECPAGIQGYGTAPQQALAAFALMIVLLLLGAAGGYRLPGWGGTCVLGALLAVGAIQSAPPMPAPPPQPYTQPLDICRPPYLAP